MSCLDFLLYVPLIFIVQNKHYFFRNLNSNWFISLAIINLCLLSLNLLPKHIFELVKELSNQSGKGLYAPNLTTDWVDAHTLCHNLGPLNSCVYRPFQYFVDFLIMKSVLSTEILATLSLTKTETISQKTWFELKIYIKQKGWDENKWERNEKSIHFHKWLTCVNYNHKLQWLF